MVKNKEKEEFEKSLEESLKDPIYVNYNLLFKLDEIKNILLANLEVNKALLQKVLEDEEPIEEERESVLREG